jgi:hypothetical protein
LDAEPGVEPRADSQSDCDGVRPQRLGLRDRRALGDSRRCRLAIMARRVGEHGQGKEAVLLRDHEVTGNQVVEDRAHLTMSMST